MEINTEELKCLRALAGPAHTPFTPCPPKLLESLRQRGLVTEQSKQWWPLGNSYCDYSLTLQGRNLLKVLKGKG
jgi:hypothetical protein